MYLFIYSILILMMIYSDIKIIVLETIML